MKKILSVLLALAIVFAFAGCKMKENDDPTSDAVASQPLQQAEDESSAADGKNEGQSQQGDAAANKDDTTKKSDDKNSNDKNSDNKNQDNKKPDNTNKPTQKATEATKPETTTKRKIKLNVIFPSYDTQERTLKIEYKKSSDKKYKELVKEDKIVLGKRQTISYDINENLIGDVDVRITINGLELLKNDFVISGKDSEATIELVAGEELHDVGFD